MAETAPILDITTKDRQKVRIDGAVYELRGSNDLALMDYQFIVGIGQRLSDLMTIAGDGKLTKAQSVELGEILDKVCSLGLIASPSVVKRLGEVEKSLLVTTFLEPLGPTVQRMAHQGLLRRAAAGVKPSRGFNGSTAATRRTGSRRSRTAR